MRSIKLAMIVFLTVIALQTQKANADPLGESLPFDKHSSLDTFSILNLGEPEKEKPKEHKIHKVVNGDTLSKIAKANKTTVQRLFDKNKEIDDPDQIKPGQKVVIPFKDEKLKHRRIAVSVVSSTPAPKHRPAGDSAGNTYGYGYCTWYVKNRRPDIPNSWGNADTWDDYAPGSGYKVGDKPKVGAIGVTRAYMHVVYIERVNKNGTVYVSEMNYEGWNVKSYRTAPASEFRYIY